MIVSGDARRPSAYAGPDDVGGARVPVTRIAARGAGRSGCASIGLERRAQLGHRGAGCPRGVGGWPRCRHVELWVRLRGKDESRRLPLPAGAAVEACHRRRAAVFTWTTDVGTGIGEGWVLQVDPLRGGTKPWSRATSAERVGSGRPLTPTAAGAGAFWVASGRPATSPRSSSPRPTSTTRHPHHRPGHPAPRCHARCHRDVLPQRGTARSATSRTPPHARPPRARSCASTRRAGATAHPAGRSGLIPARPREPDHEGLRGSVREPARSGPRSECAVPPVERRRGGRGACGRPRPSDRSRARRHAYGAESASLDDDGLPCRCPMAAGP